MIEKISVFFSNPLTALICASAVLGAGVLYIFVRSMKHKAITLPFIISIFLSACCLYFPTIEYLTALSVEEGVTPVELQLLPKFLVTVFYSMKLFPIDGNFAEIRNWLTYATDSKLITEWFEYLYSGLCILAPLSVATAILAIFKGFAAQVRMYLIVGLKQFIGCIPQFFKWSGRVLFQKYKKRKFQKELDEEKHPDCSKVYFQDCVCKGFNNVFVFSELNNKSLALAKDIKRTNRFSTFVFYDVYLKNEESFAELYEEAQKMGAIMFKKDILHFNTLGCMFGRLRRIEFFLIGENESENVSQAISLNERFKSRYNTQIFVWAINSESAAILDSINKVGATDDNYNIDDPHVFKLRIVDDIEIYVWNVLKNANLFKDENGKIREFISLLIVGMGDYGRKILKTAAWMYQMEGVRLEINTVDASDKTEKVLYAQCPELLEMNDCEREGEARYSIRFFDNVDVFESDPNDDKSFVNLLLSDNPGDISLAERLRNTTDIFVALGDDDLNIRAAMYLRKLFDQISFKKNFPGIRDEYETIRKSLKKTPRLNCAYGNKKYTIPADSEENLKKSEKFKNSKEEERVKRVDEELDNNVRNVIRDKTKAKYSEGSPQIFTQVYDQLKAQNIMKDDECILETYDDEPKNKFFDIQFKGSFSEQYKYDVINRRKEEAEAIPYHLRWSKIDARTADKEKFNQYEYFRHSSMAQALHKKMMEENFIDSVACRNDKNRQTPETLDGMIKEMKEKYACKCENCCRSRRVEHMRWNAYMRSEGYRLPPENGDKYKTKLIRAKYHYELVPYECLHPNEQKKDASLK